MKISKIIVAMLLCLITNRVGNVHEYQTEPRPVRRYSMGKSSRINVLAGSTLFSIDVVVNTSTIIQPVSFFDIILHFDPSAVKGLGGGGGGGGGAYAPFTTMSYTVNNSTGVIEVLGEYTPGVPPSDNIKLVYATFVCVQAGVASLDPTPFQSFRSRAYTHSPHTIHRRRRHTEDAIANVLQAELS